MTQTAPNIQFDLFLRAYERFKAFVEGQDTSPLTNLGTSPYLKFEEGYKKRLFEDGQAILQHDTWTTQDIGTGKIAGRIKQLLKMPNNLANWRMRDEIVKGIQSLIEAPTSDALRSFEEDFYTLYCSEQDEATFQRLNKRFGARYPLIAYLFFSKDCTRYLPTAPTYFDTAISLLGVDFKMAYQCSWANYKTFLSLIAQAQSLLSVELCIDVALLDAHSFVWMLADQSKLDNPIEDAQAFKDLPPVVRAAVIKARVGQGKFRTDVIDYWKKCALTDCSELSLLRASHIKPWRASTPIECLDAYNGILLNPTADVCFDQGFISFDESGTILISARLSNTDLACLGLDIKMRLRSLDKKHLSYLTYHREEIFK